MRGESAGSRVRVRVAMRSLVVLTLLLTSLGLAGCAGTDADPALAAKERGCLEPHDFEEGHGWATILVRRPFDADRLGFIVLKAKPLVIAWRGDDNTTNDYVSETELRTMDWMEERKIWADVSVPAGRYQWIRITVEPESVEGLRYDGYSVPVRVQGDRISVEPATESGFFEITEGHCLNVEVSSLMMYESGAYVIR